jgi:hypothetical protein
MLLDCAKLTHWRIADILASLKSGTGDYRDYMQLRKEERVLELPRLWNSLDVIHPDTKFLHTTVRLTQPWKTGLSIDFTPGTIPPLFGFIPRFWVHRPTHYQPHPDKKIEQWFFDLARDALKAGVVTRADIDDAIAHHYIRPDFLKMIA